MIVFLISVICQNTARLTEKKKWHQDQNNHQISKDIKHIYVYVLYIPKISKQIFCFGN